jgi:predicted amidophosphoribosyltransferase
MNKNTVLQWLFPTECLSCKEDLCFPKDLLCMVCQEHLELIPPHLYCEDCFTEKDEWMLCKKKHLYGVHLGAAFEEESPASALLGPLLSQNDERSAALLASFLFLQKERLRWPSPDVVIALPTERVSLFGLKATFSDLLATAFVKLVGCKKRLRACTDGYVYIIGDVLPTREKLAPVLETIYPHCPRRVFSLNLLRR